MRIAVLTEYYPTPDNPASGVYVHLRTTGYRTHGHDPRVFRSGVEMEYEMDGIPVVAGHPARVREAIAEVQPDIVVIHTPYPGTSNTEIALNLGLPTVSWIHGYEAMITAFNGYHRGFRRIASIPHDLLKLRRLRGVLTRFAGVVFVSDWIRTATERGTRFRHPRSTVIPNPVDTTRFQAPPRTSWPTRPRGLVFRALDWNLGVDVAVRALAGLTDTELVIVGTGPEAAKIRSLIQDLGAPVTLREERIPHTDVPELLAGFDYLVSPERKTPTQGVAMCEAMACGLPVIAVRAGGVPEYARHGVDGFLVPPGDVSALREAVESRLADPERALEMGRAARAFVEERCATDTIIGAELDFLARAFGSLAEAAE